MALTVKERFVLGEIKTDGGKFLDVAGWQPDAAEARDKMEKLGWWKHNKKGVRMLTSAGHSRYRTQHKEPEEYIMDQTFVSHNKKG